MSARVPRNEPYPSEEYLSEDSLECAPEPKDILAASKKLMDQQDELRMQLAQQPLVNPEAQEPLRAIDSRLRVLWAEMRYIRAEIATSGLHADSLCAVGPMPALIIRLVRERLPGLLVMTIHGRGCLDLPDVSDVAQRVLSQTEVPVLLVQSKVSQAGQLQAASLEQGEEQ